MSSERPTSLRQILAAVSPAAEGTLYEQIVAGIEKAVSVGDIQPESTLPSFRQLAEELLVSVITVKRAYEELEQVGILYRRQGLGTFVTADAPQQAKAQMLARARRLLAAARVLASDAGLQPGQIKTLFNEALNPPP
jgi:GntR family transcriptional regulator